MESSKRTKKAKNTEDIEDKQSPIREVIEFTNPVEISGDGEYLYITEIDTDSKSNVMKGLLQ
ncbi:MAG: hypothetical protein PHE79_01825 [Eubacteriales bacterium]|nr:hypothetical protein [Eubacteriales bacterium]